MKKFFIPLVLFIFVILNCKNNPIHDPDPAPIDTTKVDSVKQGETDDAPIDPKIATMLFDASYSMKGYLDSSNDSRFSGVVSYFMNIPQTVTVHFYGNEENQAIDNNDFSKKLNERQIPWSQESDIIAMIKSMKRHIKEGSDVCFLVTDAILSGSNEQIANSPNRSYNIKERQTMANNLYKGLEDQTLYSALLIRYKATFKGKYSCYDNAVRKIVNKERPFYLIAMGKWKYIKYLEKKIQEEKQSNNNIITPFENIAMFGDCNSYNEIGLAYGNGLKPESKDTYIIKSGCDEVELKSTNLTKLPNYMQTEEYLKKNIELSVKYKSKSESKVLDKDSYTISLNNEKKICSICIKSSAIKNSDLTFELKYEAPTWIETWSDDNDHDILTKPLEIDKTFNLMYLAHGFTALNNKNNIVKKQIFKIK